MEPVWTRDSTDDVWFPSDSSQELFQVPDHGRASGAGVTAGVPVRRDGAGAAVVTTGVVVVAGAELVQPAAISMTQTMPARIIPWNVFIMISYTLLSIVITPSGLWEIFPAYLVHMAGPERAAPAVIPDRIYR